MVYTTAMSSQQEPSILSLINDSIYYTRASFLVLYTSLLLYLPIHAHPCHPQPPHSFTHYHIHTRTLLVHRVILDGVFHWSICITRPTVWCVGRFTDHCCCCCTHKYCCCSCMWWRKACGTAAVVLLCTCSDCIIFLHTYVGNTDSCVRGEVRVPPCTAAVLLSLLLFFTIQIKMIMTMIRSWSDDGHRKYKIWNKK